MKNKLFLAADKLWSKAVTNGLQDRLTFFYVTDIETLLLVYKIKDDYQGNLFTSAHFSKRDFYDSKSKCNGRIKRDYQICYGSLFAFGYEYFVANGCSKVGL